MKSVCIFRRETVDMIYKLAAMKEPHKYLINYVIQEEPLYEALHKRDANKYFIDSIQYFEKRFHERLKFVVAWLEYCKIL